MIRKSEGGSRYSRGNLLNNFKGKLSSEAWSGENSQSQDDFDSDEEDVTYGYESIEEADYYIEQGKSPII